MHSLVFFILQFYFWILALPRITALFLRIRIIELCQWSGNRQPLGTMPHNLSGGDHRAINLTGAIPIPSLQVSEHTTREGRIHLNKGKPTQTRATSQKTQILSLLAQFWGVFV